MENNTIGIITAGAFANDYSVNYLYKMSNTEQINIQTVKEIKRFIGIRRVIYTMLYRVRGCRKIIFYIIVLYKYNFDPNF